MFRSLLGNLGEIRELPGTSLIAQFNVPWTSLGENSADWEYSSWALSSSLSSSSVDSCWILN
jgi:hypothetical protein